MEDVKAAGAVLLQIVWVVPIAPAVGVDCTTNAPETALVAVQQVPVTTQ